MDENYLKIELDNLVKKDEKIFDFIQAGSLDGIWYWDLENVENEWMSPKFWQTIGYDPSEKKHLSSEWKNIIFEEDLKIALDNFQKHCADPNYPYDQIVRYHHKNGSTVWVRCRGIAIRNKSGKPIRMLGAHIDITRLKLVEEEIQKLSDEYEKVFNGTQDAMFLINVDSNNLFTYRRLNKSHEISTGLITAVVVGKSPKELFGEEMGRVLEENYQRCVIKKVPITYEEELTLQAGKKTWLTILSPVIQDNKVIQIIGASRDITDRKAI